MNAIDYDGLNRLLLNDAIGFLQSILPGGRVVGKEYVCADIAGGQGSSCSINLNTGIWKDFSSDKKGGRDLISLFSAIRGINNAQAAREVEKRYGISQDPQYLNKSNGHGKSNGHDRAPVQQKPAIVVPDGVQPPNFFHPSHGESVRQWKYVDAQSRTLLYVARYQTPTGKQFCPFTYDGKKWNKYGWPDPQPLYGLDDLTLRPDAGVMMVEGEGSADAIPKLAPFLVGVTWPGGAQRWNKADLSALYGRRIVLWPDNDKVGIEAMYGIARALQPYCKHIKILDVSGQPAKWDAADALAAGWTPKIFSDWAEKHLRDLEIERIVVQSSVVPTNGNGHPLSMGEGGGQIIMPSHEIVVPSHAIAGPDMSVVKPNGHAAVISYHAKWLEWHLDCNGQGSPHANINNAVSVLEHDPQLSGLVWYDEFLQKFMTGNPAREWIDADDIHLTLYMQRELGMAKMGLDTIRSGVLEMARRHPRHVVRDWIDKLVWDGVDRIELFFVDHFGCVDTPYVRACARTFWISLLARIYRPGCKLDTMVVFEGEQGNKKSLAMRVIGGEHHSEQHESVTGKSFFETMQGKMLVEIGEMDAFTRADITRVKQVVTCSTDRYREPYARYASDHPRQCIFVGNTNRDDYLKDETGGRRFLPVKTIGQVDVDAIGTMRDQFFAESRVLLNPDGKWNDRLWHFEGGSDWWSMPDSETRAQQAARLQEDPWQEFIAKHIYFEKVGDQMYKRSVPLTSVTTNEILSSVLNVETPRIQRADERRVGAILTALGWRKRTGVDDSDPDNPHFGKIWKPGIPE